ncbi:hypothetical protein AMELA_G00107710 [Ameiurus melas]|uniref:Uncharacterized protein n=1 Tax=Ameiurus melas TaxID=219545 RepID=A0A7J6AP77_AMEME|nr:hypothetical protein AMELA_G00107710 [Ameiurus melas]
MPSFLCPSPQENNSTDTNPVKRCASPNPHVDDFPSANYVRTEHTCKKIKNEEAQESLKRENTAEGWDGVESRDAPDSEEPAGIEDSDTGSHVPPESLQEPGRETSASLCVLPDTSPPAEATKTKKKKSSKCLTSEPGGGPSATDLKTKDSDNNAKWHCIEIEENITLTHDPLQQTKQEEEMKMS